MHTLPFVSSDETRYDGFMGMTWARSATKHGISEDRSGYVIEHSRTFSKVPAPPNSPPGLNVPRRLYLHDDADGIPLEVLAIELESGDLSVIHAMEMQEKYRRRYEELKKWDTT